MSGFDASLVPVGVDVHDDPPQGLARLEAAEAAHLGDLARHRIGPRPTCDVCGARGASELDRDRVRGDVAGWVSVICRKCSLRFAKKDKCHAFP
jgi:hypothetical protein